MPFPEGVSLHKWLGNVKALTNDKLEELERYAYRSFYLRPKVVVNRLLGIRRLKDVVNDLRVAKRLLTH